LTDRFPHFRSRPLPYLNVTLRDRFWAPRQELLTTVTVPWATRHHDAAGGVEAYAAAPGTYVPDFHPGNYEAIKHVEALATVVGLTRDPTLDGLTQVWLQKLAAGQTEDGYFAFGWPLGADPAQRWRTRRDSHEAYALGHYLEAAIAYREATGRAEPLAQAARGADLMASDLLDSDRTYVNGHPEIEQALTRLYGTTGDERHLRLCGWLIEQRGRGVDPHIARSRQDHLPVRDQRTIEGHAVCAGYLFNGATEYVGATGDEGLREAVLAVFDDFVTHKMFVHGGGGNVSSRMEGYLSEPDVIAPDDAYCESCAVFANFQWAHNLFHLTGDASYLDAAERMLYNAFYASLSLSGDTFFYKNVVQAWELYARANWHFCPCCPPNIIKLLAKVGGFLYATGDDEVFVKHYAASEATLPVGGGVTLVQETDYPWDGAVTLRVGASAPVELALHLRIPAWTTAPTLSVNGVPADVDARDGWATVRRTWRDGDTVELVLPMHVRRVTMPERFTHYRRLASLQRGPLVYCLEQQDTTAPFIAVSLPEGAEVTPRAAPDLLGGVTVLEASLPQATWIPNTWDAPVPATFIPYGVWANRGPDFMAIWLQGEDGGFGADVPDDQDF
jgi:DUF1680 family protein